uniref:Uncharacterized protein n=1 Tax=Caenorhabditis japonica TaxID=281687 RepID=A0A8R1INE5_CAEJA
MVQQCKTVIFGCPQMPKDKYMETGSRYHSQLLREKRDCQRKNPQKKFSTSLVELTATPTPNQLLRDFNNGTAEADSEDKHVVRHRPAKWDADGPVRPLDP